jgi:serine/threonine protein kinase SCH9
MPVSTSTGASDLTPRPSSDRNPFDNLRTGSVSKAPSSQTLPRPHHPLLTPTSLGAVSGQYSPFIPPQAQTDLTPLGSPTTTLSIDAPDFYTPSTMSLSLPPPKNGDKKAQPELLDTPPKETMEQTPNGTPSNSSLGQIHVKLIQARGLNIASTAAVPYVVVQFEQNEFVSRDPIEESEREVRGTPRPALGSRQNSYQFPPPAPPAPAASNAMSALGAMADAHDRRKSSSNSGSSGNPSPSTSVKSTGLAGAPRPISLNNGIFGRMASSPVWKHEVSL